MTTLAAEPHVDVVVLTWNDGTLLDAAVASVLHSEAVDVRLVVVDNGSEPAASIADDPRVRLIRLPMNIGVAAARNVGAGAGTAPLVCFLDSDARLHPHTLARLARRMETDDSIALASPVFDGQAASCSGGRAPGLLRKVARLLRLTAEYGDLLPGIDGLRHVDFTIGACQLVRRTCMESVGGLDEEFFYGPEDVDFCLRLRARGWEVVQVDDAHCYHPPRRSHRRLLTRQGARHALAVCRFLWRHRATRRRLREAI